PPQSIEEQSEASPGPKRSIARLFAFIGGGLVAIAGVIVLLVFLLVPSTMDQNLQSLKSTHPAKRGQALEWFADAEPEDADRARVTSGLEALLFDGERRDVDSSLLVRAYLAWAGKDKIDAMIRLVRTPSPHWNSNTIGLIMHTLGTMQDRRAAEV